MPDIKWTVLTEQNFGVVHERKGWLIKPTAREDGARSQPRRATWMRRGHLAAMWMLC